MASNQKFKSTKKRSHSSPELQFTTTSGESGDENVKRILHDLAEYKDKVENSQQQQHLREQSQSSGKVKHTQEKGPGCEKNDADEIVVLDSTDVTTASETKNHAFFKGFKILSHLLGRMSSKDAEKKASVSEDLTQNSLGPRQQRSKSVCATLLHKFKSKSQKQSNNSSSSDDSDSDIAKVYACNVEKGNKQKKHKRRKVKSTSAINVDLWKATFPKQSALKSCSQGQCEEEGKTNRTVQDVPSGRTVPSTSETSLLDGDVISTPSFYRAPVTLADMLRNSQEQPVLRQAASNIPASQPLPQVVTTTQNIYAHYDALSENGTFSHRTVHTQIDYMHCLIPDQWSIINSPYYWGQINRYEADNLLANKGEGTFILRDSTQEEFVFSVSFRRYGRTLHARIEQWNHKFTFDAHDPGVHSSQTICGLLEHYKNPNFCMFFEPMLTAPLLKKNPQSLQELCRARICTHIKYNDISSLKLPIAMREYLRVYHYKQRLRVRKMEVDRCSVEENQPGVITNTCLSPVHSIVL